MEFPKSVIFQVTDKDIAEANGGGHHCPINLALCRFFDLPNDRVLVDFDGVVLYGEDKLTEAAEYDLNDTAIAFIDDFDAALCKGLNPIERVNPATFTMTLNNI